ncbi:chromate transporter [Spirosoma soli]
MMHTALLEPQLAPYFTSKAPFQFPASIRDAFVRYWSFLSLILVLLLLPPNLLFPELGITLMPISLVESNPDKLTEVVTIALITIGTVLSVMALPGLFNRKRSGWVFTYYAQLLGVLTSALSMSVLGVLLGLAFLMLLFQVREFYS